MPTHTTVPIAAGRLALEHQTVLGLPPVEFVHLAADLGCRYIAAVLVGNPVNPHGYEPFSLRDDAALRHRTIAAMREREVSISLAEGFVVRPGGDVRGYAADLDVMAGLGAAVINTVTMDPDLGRSHDEFGTLAEMAGERGMQTTIEFAPSLTIGDLDSALAAVRHVARPDFRLLIDTMHLVRSGHTPADLAAVDPTLIAYAQLSDNTIRQRGTVYREDSIDRMVPGEGELPLRDILAVLPPDIVIGLEVPMLSAAQAGEPTEERARRCVQAARDLLTATGAVDQAPRTER
ncbi:MULTISPECIES: sugar phosphate isomerase/epimerase [Parafrankia]|uniref:Xylose isomerase n=1 Tax=Parafrankia colletiae TaxID=573497 RepID=A0A1S1QW82_9ACTN|nr:MULTISPECIES: sugar phosphate isomerase/epimerase [Parafrankia]MCK9899606.1 sugar phosphate isomerase/epimerase [Frankia sp. Cpl3]OHV37967.1 xylose isomerase [Parafrankia colletiae]TCJ32995.1 sugar phosphate isomerase/epimerase [Parafrankia sp. BMG5.11]